MAKPSRPFARAAVMISSGLETPSPEKNECVCRSKLNGIGETLVCKAQNGKCWFQRMGGRLRGARAWRRKHHPAQRGHRRGPGGFLFQARRILSLSDVV